MFESAIPVIVYYYLDCGCDAHKNVGVIAPCVLVPCLGHLVEGFVSVVAETLILVLAMLEVLMTIEPFVHTFIEALEPHKGALDRVKSGGFQRIDGLVHIPVPVEMLGVVGVVRLLLVDNLVEHMI